MKRAAIILLSLTATACAFRPQLENVAVDHNAIVANTANELVLVNILRARERQPLHITAVSKLFGDAQLSGTVGANSALKGETPTVKTDKDGALVETSTAGGIDVTTPSFSLTASGRTSMDVTVFDTQDFYQGFTSSVPAGTLAHYLHQGWPDELLTYLFVGSVDFVVSKKVEEDPVLNAKYKAGRVLETLVNDPDDAALSEDFRAFVNCYRLTVQPKSVPDRALVPLASVKELSLADIAVLDGEKYDVDDVTPPGTPPVERWVRRKGRTADSLALRKVDKEYRVGEDARCGTNLIEAAPAASPAALALGSYPFKAARFSFTDPNLDPLPFDLQADSDHGTVGTGFYQRGSDKVPVDVQVVLRSVEGVIYFLGQYIRAPNPNYKLFIGPGNYVPIMAVTTTRPAHQFVNARFQRVRYYVPGSPYGQLDAVGGRSSQVFGLVQQLINLQKSGKDRPATQTVRVVQ